MIDKLFSPGTEVRAKYPSKFKGRVADEKPSDRNRGKIPVNSGRQIKWFYPSELRIVDDVPLISRDREWSVGDRCQLAKSVGIITEVNGASVRVLFSDAADSTGKGAWVSKEHVCQISEPVDSLKVLVDSLEPPTSLEDSIGEFQSSKAQALVKFCDRNSSTQSGREISEDFTQAQANTILLSVDSPAPIHQEPAIEPESATPIQNQGQCSENSLELLVKPSQSSSFWSNLPDLSIEVLERGLEDCEWEDILVSIQSSRAAINLEHRLSGREFLSFPTLTAGHGNGHRDAGLTKCEKWFQQSGVIPNGSQLSPEAIATLHGFPADWFKAISPRCIARHDTQADSLVENWAVKPSPSHKQDLPSNGLNGYGQNFSREWKLGDRIELIELIDKKCRRAIGDTGIIDEVKASLIQVKWDKKRPKTNSWTVFSNDTSSIRLIEQYPAANQLPTKSLENLTIEQQLEPRDADCLGKTVYHDGAEKLGTVTHLEIADLGGSLPAIRYAHIAWWWKCCLIDAFNTERSRVPADELELVSDEQLVYELTCEVKSLGKYPSKQIGSLYQYTSNHRGKDGIIREYPIVEGERQRDNDEHWYWGLSYIERNHRGKWCDKSASIPGKSLVLARQLMREKFLYTDTIAISQLKFLWIEEKGRYLIGEIKPEVCPRLCVVSLDEKDYILSAPNWGELRAGDRMALSRKIREAIADNQPLEVIKGLLL